CAAIPAPDHAAARDAHIPRAIGHGLGPLLPAPPSARPAILWSMTSWLIPRLAPISVSVEQVLAAVQAQGWRNQSLELQRQATRLIFGAIRLQVPLVACCYHQVGRACPIHPGYVTGGTNPMNVSHDRSPFGRSEPARC